ncbi:MAG: hypothetical protein GY696_06330 [Gammaproteobacteria bacterium]|nr:hypothetical protein [Gammaproteobacteria bacterium]
MSGIIDATKTTSVAHMTASVESICNKGCQAVRLDIRLIEKGGFPDEMADLSTEDQQSVLFELKK